MSEFLSWLSPESSIKKNKNARLSCGLLEITRTPKHDVAWPPTSN